MGMGLISESVLGDIANAIREQNGTSATYKPSEMAAAVAALDGSKAGDGSVATLGSATGVIGDSVFSAIADAIRGQNGLETKYKPGEMAQAIRDLVWDAGLKPRALWLSDGTLEFNYLDGRQVRSGSGKVVSAWEVSTAGYAKEGDRPWDGVRLKVKRAYIDESFSAVVSELGMTNFDWFFKGFSSMTEVVGFQHLSGMTAAKQMFVTCPELETIWATSFDASALASSSMMFSGAYRLVGGTDFKTCGQSTAGSVCKVGAGGVLTNPADDRRQWLWGTVYGDGVCEVSASSEVDASREVVAHGRGCAQASYASATALPWGESKGKFTRVRVLADMATAGFSALRLDYWFYSMNGVTAFEGLGNLRPVASMRFAFASCTGVEEIDLSGLDPSKLTDLFYAFSSCSALTTIYADPAWELPSGATGNQCFYSCKALVGGNGTAWDSTKTSYKYCVIDRDEQEGYLTAKS